MTESVAVAEPFAGVIRSEEELRQILPPPHGRATEKQIDHLDHNCRAFIAHAPFVLVGTTNADGTGDVSPKGGPPGFVTVLDEHRLVMGELPGNNRADGYRNVIANPAVGLIFLIPGLGETLRVNGRGYVVTDHEVLDACGIDGRRPKLALGVQVVETFIHCAKALRRAQLWDPAHWPDLTTMPSPACMLVEHVGLEGDPDGSRTAAALEQNYATTLWNADS
jgi:PPOX class probable FMN-dependent enzyme